MSTRGTVSLEENWNTSPWPWSLPAPTRHLCTSVPVVTTQRCTATSSLHKIQAKQGGRGLCPQDSWTQDSTWDCTKVLPIPYISFPILVSSKTFPIGIKVSDSGWYFTRLESLNPNEYFLRQTSVSSYRCGKILIELNSYQIKKKLTLNFEKIFRDSSMESLNDWFILYRKTGIVVGLLQMGNLDQE